MATDMEIRKTQKAFLYDLLKAKKENKPIDDLIEMMRAEMEQEDFAYVEKVIGGS